MFCLEFGLCRGTADHHFARDDKSIEWRRLTKGSAPLLSKNIDYYLKHHNEPEQNPHAISITFRCSRFRGQEEHSGKHEADDELARTNLST